MRKITKTTVFPKSGEAGGAVGRMAGGDLDGVVRERGVKPKSGRERVMVTEHPEESIEGKVIAVSLSDALVMHAI